MEYLFLDNSQFNYTFTVYILLFHDRFSRFLFTLFIVLQLYEFEEYFYYIVVVKVFLQGVNKLPNLF